MQIKPSPELQDRNLEISSSLYKSLVNTVPEIQPLIDILLTAINTEYTNFEDEKNQLLFKIQKNKENNSEFIKKIEEDFQCQLYQIREEIHQTVDVSYRNKFEQMQQQISLYQQETYSYSNQINEVIEERNALKNEIQLLKDDFKKQNNNYDNDIHEISSQHVIKDSIILNLESIIDDKNMLLDELKELMNVMKEQESSYKNEILQLTSQLKISNETNQRLLDSIDCLKNKNTFASNITSRDDIDVSTGDKDTNSFKTCLNIDSPRTHSLAGSYENLQTELIRHEYKWISSINDEKISNIIPKSKLKIKKRKKTYYSKYHKLLKKILQKTKNKLSAVENSVHFSARNNNQQIKLNSHLKLPVASYRYVILGESGVGKTTFIKSLLKQNESKAPHNPTIGVEFYRFNILYDNSVYEIEIWDTAGQEKFNSLTTSYLRKADGAFIMYDVSDVNSFLHARKWIQIVKEKSKKNTMFIIVANKADKRQSYIENKNSPSANDSFMISYNMGSKLAISTCAPFIEVCSTRNINIEEACLLLTGIVKKNENNPEQNKFIINLATNKNNDNNKFCC